MISLLLVQTRNHHKTSDPVIHPSLTDLCQSCSDLYNWNLCKEDLKDPVLFMCGHQSCKQCVSLYWNQKDPPVDHPCHKCKVHLQNNTENTGKLNYSTSLKTTDSN
uniref:Zinc finger C3HC4 RING-type domain-containing protein n=1 Tax=Anabas testudineus TaxID=64144 RepID=A0A7N6AFH4_ANATE